jgi:CRP/FNR family cyclic AMP-dependent transcriptional regulator
MNEADLLAEVSIFSHMKKRDLRRVAKLTNFQSFRNGDVIVREGARDQQFFLIVSGEVEVIKGLGSANEWCLRTLGPRGYFGEMALIDDLVRTSSIVAKTDTQVLILDQLNLREQIEKNPGMAIELLQMLGRRIRDIEKKTMEMLGVFLPICASCKKKFEEIGSWTVFEKSIGNTMEPEIQEIFCQECEKTLFAKLLKD